MKLCDTPEEKFKAWFYDSVGANIRDARMKTGDTQEALANALNISRVSMVNIESGKQRLPVHLLYDVAGLLNISVNDLLPKRSDFKP